MKLRYIPSRYYGSFGKFWILIKFQIILVFIEFIIVSSFKFLIYAWNMVFYDFVGEKPILYELVINFEYWHLKLLFISKL